MKKLTCILSGISLLLLVTACGGGSDGSAAATAATPATGASATPYDTAGAAPASAVPAPASYAGTWLQCGAEGQSTSSKQTLVITQESATTYTGLMTRTSYASPLCAGAAGITETSTAAVTLTGTKTIGDDLVDKVIVTVDQRAPFKTVFLLKGTAPAMLFFGKDASEGGAVDADGYPTTLEAGASTRQ